MKSNSQDSNENQKLAKVNKLGFWKRQFQTEATTKQKIFDWFFGVILPVFCVVADPIVFKGAFSHRGALLGEYKPFAYSLSFISIILLMLFLLFGKKLNWFNAMLAGLFLVGSSVCLIVGVLLLPFSLLGLIFLIGVLGFTPLFSAFVYARNAVRAIDYAESLNNKMLLFNLIGVSAIFSFVLPYVFYANIERSINNIEFGTPNEIRQEVKRLKIIKPLVNVDRLGTATCGTPENEVVLEKRNAFYELSTESPEKINMRFCIDW